MNLKSSTTINKTISLSRPFLSTLNHFVSSKSREFRIFSRSSWIPSSFVPFSVGLVIITTNQNTYFSSYFAIDTHLIIRLKMASLYLFKTIPFVRHVIFWKIIRYVVFSLICFGKIVAQIIDRCSLFHYFARLDFMHKKMFVYYINVLLQFCNSFSPHPYFSISRKWCSLQLICYYDKS